MVIDKGLREKVAKLVSDAFVTCGSYTVEEPDALETADAILAIPEIKEALAFAEALRTPGSIKLISEPPIYTGEKR